MVKQEKIWVHIETNKGINNLVVSYRGTIALRDFNEWVSGDYNKKCIKLSEAYWVVNEWDENSEEGQRKRFVLYRIPNHSKDNFNICTGEIYLIASHIVAIYLLKDSSERDSVLLQNPLVWNL